MRSVRSMRSMRCMRSMHAERRGRRGGEGRKGEGEHVCGACGACGARGACGACIRSDVRSGSDGQTVGRSFREGGKWAEKGRERRVGERELPTTEHHSCVRAFNGHKPPSRLEKDKLTADGTWCRLACWLTRCVHWTAYEHTLPDCQDCLSAASLPGQVLIACRIARFTVGWALQGCTAAFCFAVLYTPALSNTRFCRVPDSCPNPQARLPRLPWHTEPLSPSAHIWPGGRIARLPTMIWNGVYTCIKYGIKGNL